MGTLLRWAWFRLHSPSPRRMDGVEAVSWRNSVFTRGRTDLPFPTDYQLYIPEGWV